MDWDSKDCSHMMDHGEEKKVLICVDTSEHSDYAFQYYFEHLHQPRNLVVIAHSAESPYHYARHLGASGGKCGPSGTFYPRIPHTTIDHLIEGQRTEINRVTAHYQRLLQQRKINAKHKFAVNQHDGHTGQGLVDLAEQENASLIVVGSRGLGRLRRTILGSVSHYVLHHSKVPVMVCHLHKEKDNSQEEKSRSEKKHTLFQRKHRDKERGKTD